MALPADIINLATNPAPTSTTNFTVVSGTGGTAAIVYNSFGYSRATWSVATTSPSGGQFYKQTGTTAGTPYQMWVNVRSSVAQTITLTADFKTAGNTLINTVTGVPVAVAANTWTRIGVAGTAGANTTYVNLNALASGSNWAINDTFDMRQIVIAYNTNFRTNLLTNPSFETGTTGWAANTGTPTLTSDAAFSMFGTKSLKAVSTTSSQDIAVYASPATALTAGTTYTMSWYVYSPDLRTATFDIAGGATGLGSTVIQANTWTRVVGTFTAATTGSPNIYMHHKFGPAGPGPTIYIDGAMLEASPTVGAYFDGSTTPSQGLTRSWTGAVNASASVEYTGISYFDGSFAPDASYRYFWTGTANASTSHAEYRGVWVETIAGAGAPAVQVTVSGLGTVAGLVQVTRTADGETWTVPGWYDRSVVDTDTDPDFAVPLGRNVTYTVFFNGAQIGQMSITVPSNSGWVQSPYDPTSAMPINTTLLDNTALTLAKGSLDSRTHAANSTRVTVMGASRPHSIGGQRMADASAAFVLHAWKNATSDQFKAMIGQAPVLLIRGLPSWGSIPGLAYLDAPAQENDVSHYKNYPRDGLTQWVLAGDLIQPVSRKPLTGTVTNDMVQTNCAGVSYNTILARSGSKKNVDVKANPLGL